MSNEEIIQAFHLMWDNFPEAVMITQKSREIVAINKKAAEMGLAVGLRCSSMGEPTRHKGCLCDKAVDENKAQYVTYDGEFGKAYGYWIPIPEKPEWVIHFGVGHAFEYKKFTREPQAKKNDESLHNLTTGTELENAVGALAVGEANGVMMYYALARLAKEQGMPEVAQTFIESANQEAVHAGFYAVLNGKVPKDFWKFVAGVAKAEYKGEKKIKELADAVRAAGFAKAADEMEVFAKQEAHHGVVIDNIMKKYAPVNSEPAQKTFVCSVCGYEHTGDTPPEKCPVCGQPSSVFTEKVETKSAPVKSEPTQKTFVCTVCGYEHVGDTPPEVCPLCGQPASAFVEKN